MLLRLLLFVLLPKRLVVPLLSLLPPPMPLPLPLQSQVKCVYEEINANVLVVGEWEVHSKDDPSQIVHVDIRVSTGGHVGMFNGF